MAAVAAAAAGGGGGGEAAASSSRPSPGRGSTTSRSSWPSVGLVAGAGAPVHRQGEGRHAVRDRPARRHQGQGRATRSSCSSRPASRRLAYDNDKNVLLVNGVDRQAVRPGRQGPDARQGPVLRRPGRQPRSSTSARRAGRTLKDLTEARRAGVPLTGARTRTSARPSLRRRRRERARRVDQGSSDTGDGDLCLGQLTEDRLEPPVPRRSRSSRSSRAMRWAPDGKSIFAFGIVDGRASSASCASRRRSRSPPTPTTGARASSSRTSRKPGQGVDRRSRSRRTASSWRWSSNFDGGPFSRSILTKAGRLRC